ncbi:protein angel homolog 1-like isoform X1 [Centruroides sculpturatus]|uniref:protein angel homolog 1-like isoform X1 n=1 Tax=Centruroides sculpturatus TaxID=218467 RepID=UPI000C6D3097|nr:protein angel homolog 1-like isoform X1 [Centruroides sculpturatus]XP_023219966.1 protein angel homolog 1-like isoform X1 [Centruroides sculpturatus]
MNNLIRLQKGTNKCQPQKYCTNSYSSLNKGCQDAVQLSNFDFVNKWFYPFPFYNSLQLSQLPPTICASSQYFSSYNNNTYMEEEQRNYFKKERKNLSETYFSESSSFQQTNEKLQQMNPNFSITSTGLPVRTFHAETSMNEQVDLNEQALRAKKEKSSVRHEETKRSHKRRAKNKRRSRKRRRKESLKDYTDNQDSHSHHMVAAASIIPTSSNQLNSHFITENLCRSIRHLRQWQYTSYGKRHLYSRRHGLEFTLMSYNILAQKLLEDNSLLYCHCEPNILDWEYRSKNLLQEIQELQCDIICLQEVQDDHYYNLFKPFLENLGYYCLYKKRTSTNKWDGCAIFFKTNMFSLVDYHLVEFYRPGIPLLDRDNVAIIALLKPNCVPTTSDLKLCIATTHLLFNPRRGDVKLAQIRLLLAELDKIAFKRVSSNKQPIYYPIVMCGDMNSEPFSPLYNFISRGKLDCRGLMSGDISGQKEGARKGQKLDFDQLLHPELDINQNTQYEEIFEIRYKKDNVEPVHNLDEDNACSIKTDDAGLNEENKLNLLGTNCNLMNNSNEEKDEKNIQNQISNNSIVEDNSIIREINTKANITVSSDLMSNLKASLSYPFELPFPKYIQHHIKFLSTYKHFCAKGCREITTQHTRANCTVDYIFYSVKDKYSFIKNNKLEHKYVTEGALRLLACYRLLNDTEVKEVGGLPNACQPSDHLSLVNKFLLKTDYDI